MNEIFDPKSAVRSFISDAGRLKSFPSKRRKQLCCLYLLAEGFEHEKSYTETQVNAILDSMTEFHDPATLRRDLVDCGFLSRNSSCTEYSICPELPSFEKLGLA